MSLNDEVLMFSIDSCFRLYRTRLPSLRGRTCSCLSLLFIMHLMSARIHFILITCCSDTNSHIVGLPCKKQMSVNADIVNRYMMT